MEGKYNTFVLSDAKTRRKIDIKLHINSLSWFKDLGPVFWKWIDVFLCYVEFSSWYS